MQRFLFFFLKSLRISKKSSNFAAVLHPETPPFPLSKGEKGFALIIKKNVNDEKSYHFDVHCRDGIVMPARGVQSAGV